LVSAIALLRKTMNSSDSSQDGATVVITHRVRAGAQAGYDDWLNEIGPVCRAAPGHLDWQIVRPVAGLTTSYTVIIRFDTPDDLRRWMESPERRRLIEKVRPFLADDDDYTIHSGLDFLFTPKGAKTKVPVRWKQFLLTWSAIYPLSLAVPFAVVPLMRFAGLPERRWLNGLLVTGTIVLLMVYLVMPRYTKLVRRWLFD
jgi:antibiotic biosynthesis monooxygenase (ABM) superfamily enzyme